MNNNMSWLNLGNSNPLTRETNLSNDYNSLNNRPIKSLIGTSQNPIKLWTLDTGLYIFDGYVQYTNALLSEAKGLFASITVGASNGQYVLSAFIPFWEGQYEYILSSLSSETYINHQVIRMITQGNSLTLDNIREYTPSEEYHPSTKKYVDDTIEIMRNELGKMGLNNNDIQSLMKENRRRDIAIQALLSQNSDKMVTIDEEVHDISMDYSLDEGIAKFVDGELEILNEGRVTIKAIERKSSLVGNPLVCEMEIRCVQGVEVGTYDDLVQATEDGCQVVLTNDIDLGIEVVRRNGNGTTTQLYSDAECASILQSEVKSIQTSWEWNYYKHAKGYTEPPTINYIIKFTDNLYGNGYKLNANNITNMVDATGALYPFAVFRGPLTLVELPEAKVMAQDNICFIATDGVVLNNVELIGADLGGYTTSDLTALDYVGTVLEVMGDGVKIVNSKIQNGRTCVRVYGKESGNFEKINVLIESCEISYGREFLIKMGTNKKLPSIFDDGKDLDLSTGTMPESVWEECAPSIENYRHLNDAKLTQDQYNALVEEYKADEKFQNLVNTNLTVKNCVLHTSGLFSIGLESSFAGPALAGARYGDSYNFDALGWKEIAGTSYPTQLNLEGNVKIYDWKKLANIDSSKLIEGSLINFDLAQMIKNMYEEGDLTEIITTDGTHEYAHGGIVMYGGGKNYCLINNNMTDKADYLNFTINLDSLKVSSSNPFEAQLMKLLKYASGREDFRFLMCGKNSDLNYYQQILELENGDYLNYRGKYVF